MLENVTLRKFKSWTFSGELSLYLHDGLCRWLPFRFRSMVEVFQKTIMMGTVVTSIVKPCPFSGHLLACVLLLCLMFFSLGLHVESSPVFRHSSKYSMCDVVSLESRTRAVMLSGCISATWVSQMHVWHHYHPHFPKLLDKTSQDLRSFPSC